MPPQPCTRGRHDFTEWYPREHVGAVVEVVAAPNGDQDAQGEHQHGQDANHRGARGEVVPPFPVGVAGDAWGVGWGGGCMWKVRVGCVCRMCACVRACVCDLTGVRALGYVARAVADVLCVCGGMCALGCVGVHVQICICVFVGCVHVCPGGVPHKTWGVCRVAVAVGGGAVRGFALGRA